jgi:hypothetical protein
MTDRETSKTAFFVGYLSTPRPLAWFLAVVTVIMAGIGIGAGLAVALGQQDPGKGRFAFDQGYQSLSGVIQAKPYPVLRLPATEGKPARTIALSGQGKRGQIRKAAALDGQKVDIGGVFITRDGIEMLQVGGRVKLAPTKKPEALAEFEPAADIPLGRHRLRGEIIDSKCYLGAMRPGRGKVHMACAGLCVMGGIPPMFVVYRAEGPADVLLLAGPDGGPIPESLLDQISLYVSLEGDVIKRDNQMIFMINPNSMEVL